MEKMYKFRAYPNKKQREQMAKTFGCTRFVYNYYLAKTMDMYEKDKTNMSYYDMCKDLTKLKKEKEWLNDADKYALQNSLKLLNQAYQRYFSEMKRPGYEKFSEKKLRHYKDIGYTPTLYDRAWHPKFKKKSSHNYSYRTQNGDYKRKNQLIMFCDKKIRLPKLGWIKIKDRYVPNGKILNATIEQVPSGKYYVCICCECEKCSALPKTNKNIGIDLGVKSFCVFSDGEIIEKPNYFNNTKKKIGKLQCELARKTIGGSNWNKTRIKLAKVCEKYKNQQEDFLQKLSTRIVFKNDIICLEDLSIQEMLISVKGENNKQNANIRNSIKNCSFGSFVRKIEYKSNWYGRTCIKIDRYFPSSQTCHICGHKNISLKDESIRTWICPNCGTYHNRDVNAAINILNEGLKKIV